jgi:hypothetical protein
MTSQRNDAMIAPWAMEEMAAARLEDKRLNERLTKILSDLGERPTASIPAACGGHKEMTAAYRFFDNPKVTYEKVLEPHLAATRRRMAEQQVVLLVQDTTEANLTRPRQQVEGAGPLDGGPRRGAFVHLMEAFTPDGTPLGAAAVKIWTRDEEEQAKPQSQKRRERQAAPIEEKESFRWLECLRMAREVAQELPNTSVVCVADSEADIFELFAEPRGDRPVDWIIRACQDRSVYPAADAEERHIRDRVLGTAVLFTREITVRDRDPKTACETRNRRVSRTPRVTEVEVRATKMTLCPPTRPDGKLPAVTINVVLVSEANPPAGEPAVEWILVTTLPIDRVEQVEEIIRYYCVRWMIEIFQPDCASSAVVYQAAA